jgi:hypothetical protein
MIDDELDALGYLQAVYRGKIVAEHQRMKAAIEALPFERPRLSANANVAVGFGRHMERIGRAAGQSTVIDASPNRDSSHLLESESHTFKTGAIDAIWLRPG